MNRYRPILSDVLRHMGFSKSSNFDKSTIYGMIEAYVRPDILRKAYSRHLTELGRYPLTNYQMQRVIADARSSLFYEAFWLFHGVTVIVEDTHLVEALIRTKIDAIAGDVRVPFPIVEFVFPSGIKFRSGEEINGVILIDLEQFDVEKEWYKEDANIKRLDPRGRPLAHYAVISRIRTKDIEGDVVVHRFSKDQILYEHKTDYMDEDKKEYIQRMAQLVMALCLYVQCCQDRNKVMQPLKSSKPKIQGLPSKIASKVKKHKHFCIIDLLGIGREYKAIYTDKDTVKGDVYPMDGITTDRASPHPHWRTWTLRSLRHKRYQRNPDGSMRVTLVRPCLVGVRDKGSPVLGKRKIAIHDIQNNFIEGPQSIEKER